MSRALCPRRVLEKFNERACEKPECLRRTVRAEAAQPWHDTGTCGGRAAKSTSSCRRAGSRRRCTPSAASRTRSGTYFIDTAGVHLVDETTTDAVVRFTDVAAARSTTLEKLGLAPRAYVLGTIRVCNIHEAGALGRLLTALDAAALAPDVRLNAGEGLAHPAQPRERL